MKKVLILFLCVSFSASFSQDFGLNLIDIKKNDTVFIAANKRIKLLLKSGNKLAGRFTIINNTQITIKDQTIALDSIVNIRQVSSFASAAEPTCATLGAIFITGGLAGIAAGGFNLLATMVLLPPGLPMFILPLTVNKHDNKKWKYEIVN